MNNLVRWYQETSLLTGFYEKLETQMALQSHITLGGLLAT